MPKINRLTKAEREHRKRERARKYYEKNRKKVNKRAREGMRRFRARISRREASAECEAHEEAQELNRRKDAARSNSRHLAQWPRKKRSPKFSTQLHETSPAEPADLDLDAPSDNQPDIDDRGNDRWGVALDYRYTGANLSAQVTTIPTSSLRDAAWTDDLPPSSPPSDSDQESYDSDNSIPVAPYSEWW